jgi:hypothetical protein
MAADLYWSDMMIANLQYGWTFFVPDIEKAFHWNRPGIQTAFTLFVPFETWLTGADAAQIVAGAVRSTAPASGSELWRDRGGPRRSIDGSPATY